jgi:hypothetical protein
MAQRKTLSIFLPITSKNSASGGFSDCEQYYVHMCVCVCLTYVHANICKPESNFWLTITNSFEDLSAFFTEKVCSWGKRMAAVTNFKKRYRKLYVFLKLYTHE